MIYEIWDTDSGNMLSDHVLWADTHAYMRRILEADQLGSEFVADLMLIYEHGGKSTMIAKGEDLVALVRKGTWLGMGFGPPKESDK